MNLIVDGLILPAACLALLAWVVPKLLSVVLPEGVRPLIVNALLSTMILFALSTAFFSLLYAWKGVSWDELAGFGGFANIVFFWKIGPDFCADLGADYGVNGGELAERLGEGGMVT